MDNKYLGKHTFMSPSDAMQYLYGILLAGVLYQLGWYYKGFDDNFENEYSEDSSENKI